MKDRLIIVKSFASLGALFLVIALTGQSSPSCGFASSGAECVAASDCQGLAHETCAGEWQCVQGECVWECNQSVAGCHSDADCPKGEHCSVSDGECLTDPSCPMCDVCYGKCVPDKQACVQSGCSGEVCAAEPQFTNCVWQDWFTCLKLTKCGTYGPSGTCAFEPNQAFLDCIAQFAKCSSDTDCPKGLECINGKCVQEQGCLSDTDCNSYEYCAYLDPGKGVACCPPNAFCAPEIPPCGKGVCLLRPGYCWSDSDCDKGEKCEGAIVCPEGAYCLVANKPGKCVAQGLKCKVVKPGSHGMCEMAMGWVFDGEQCVMESGCSCEPDCDAFFATSVECQLACGIPITCESDKDCPKGYCCMAIDCPAGADCWPYNVCEPCAVSCVSDKDCDDGNKCTLDRCIAGTCSHEPLLGCGWCENDKDGDGYFDFCNPGDCDDTNPAVFPGAKEICDGIDNDCDGLVDEDGCGHECKSDADCAWYEYCAFTDYCTPDSYCGLGVCTIRPGYCWTDANCQKGEHCEGAIICPPGAYCFIADQPGKCVPNVSKSCMSDTDCGPGMMCDKSQCLSCCTDPSQPCIALCCGKCVPLQAKCQTDSDCGVGQYCELSIDAAGIISGKCTNLPEGACVRDTDCGEGGKCVIGACPECFPCPCFGKCEYQWTCQDHSDCPPGQECKQYCGNGWCKGVCEPLPKGMCWSDKDCNEGYYCNVLKCSDAKCIGPYECVPGKPVCFRTGCSGEVCASEAVMTPCVYQPWFECLAYTECGNYGPNGSCGFAQTNEFLKCLSKYGK